MTLALSLKVNDGLVFAADSAATLIEQDPHTGAVGVTHVYKNANKIFNLKKGLPVGAITWGAGSIGSASISTLAKDLRRRLTGADAAHLDWALDENKYTIAEVAQRLRAFMYEEHFTPAFGDWPYKPGLGFIVGGYSAMEQQAEHYQVYMDGNGCADPEPVTPPDQCGLSWRGEPEAITRLVVGFSPRLEEVFAQNLGVPMDQRTQALAIIQQALHEPLFMPAMPIRDAIDLADFLVDTAISYARFRRGAATVGGPVEVAAITKHEGFKWICRKYYYSRELNPEEG
jgi:hypothetical protein